MVHTELETFTMILPKYGSLAAKFDDTFKWAPYSGVYRIHTFFHFTLVTPWETKTYVGPSTCRRARLNTS